MSKMRGAARRAVVLHVLVALCASGLASAQARTRVDVAGEYYRQAREAIDGGDEAQYRDYLGKAQRELLAAIRRDPGDPEAHTQMGIILVYQGNLDQARTSFLNALRLHKKRFPGGRRGDGGYYTNIAHTDLYRGKPRSAQRYLEVGRRRGAPPAEVDRIDTLLAWRSGDLTEAREIFTSARDLTPGYADTWDTAPLPQRMKSFEDFCAACCRNPSCGPYLRDACNAEQQTVKEREVTRETLVEEMRLERERQAKLKEIYKGDRNVSIEVEKSGDQKPPGDKTAAPAPAVPRAKPAR
jgi:tetratricopeptide (TPR) repeat protein